MIKRKSAVASKPPTPTKANKKPPAVESAGDTQSLNDITNTKDRDLLSRLMIEYRERQENIAVEEALNKALKRDKIEPLLVKLKVRRAIKGDTWHAIRVQGSKSTIVAERLLEHGVGMDVIEESTETKTWENWQVRGVKGGNSDE
jgi:hypothetical protein